MIIQSSQREIDFSIQLSSNRPFQIVRLLDSIEETANNPNRVEVLVHIDVGDIEMEKLLECERTKRTLKLHYLQTDLVKGFNDIWRTYNLLFKNTHKDAYFLAILSDEMRFETHGWDTLLLSYLAYYPDHIFRIRCSKYRFRNYMDFWECGFAPDSTAFYTYKWLSVQGDWNPCSGPDSFQQCIAFYLFTSDSFSHSQFYRDISLPHLHFSGEGASIGLEGEALKQRIRDNLRTWFILMSHRMQQEAKRRAMLLKATIIASTIQDNKQMTVQEDARSCAFLVYDSNGVVVEKLSYRLSYIRITLTNFLRAPLVHYYGGGGTSILKTHPWNGIKMLIDTYIPGGTTFLQLYDQLWEAYHRKIVVKLRDRRNYIVGMTKDWGLLAGICSIPDVLIEMLLPHPFDKRYIALKIKIRDCRNHIKGTLDYYGFRAGIKALYKEYIRPRN